MELPNDPMILELYGDFVEQWLNDINEQWDTLIQEKKADMQSDFYRFAHTLKGSGYQFGITPLGDAGIELMSLIKTGQLDDVPPFKERLVGILQDASDSFKAYTAGK
jgi:chemotaxis protein histidine kinase CheA